MENLSYGSQKVPRYPGGSRYPDGSRYPGGSI
jgi:hypothetical protein